MALLRAFSKVDEDGRVTIPECIQRGTEIKKGQLVEIKMQGTASARYITMKAYKQGRRAF